MPVGDVQYGAQGVAKERLQRHIEWGLKNNAYFLGMGDYVDVMSPSNREAYRSVRLYDSVREAMVEKAEEHISDFLKLVKGTEGRWLGLLQGHHFFEFEDGTTSDTRIAAALKSTFLGTCAFIRLRFTRSKSSRLACIIWAHHGAGGGQKQGAPLNKLENLVAYFDADIYLMGHMTKKPAAPIPRIYMSDHAPYKLLAKQKIIAGTGGWYEGYHQGSKHHGGVRAEGSYVEKAMMSPVAIGGIVLKVRPVHGGGGNDRLDLGVEL